MIDQSPEILPDFMLIGEDRIASAAGGEFEHYNAATGKVQRVLPVAGADDVDRAVQAAKAALKIWAAWAPTERRRALQRLANLLREERDELGVLLSLEIGYPLTQSPFVVDWGVEWIDVNAGWADRLYGEVLDAPGFHNYSSIEPLGVIGVIPTWNGSVGSFGMSCGPALAAGCTVVVKPSEFAPFGPLRCAELALKAGIPAGVVNVVTGTADTATALIGHPDIEKVVFTGSPGVGRKIAVQCAELLRPAVLELGGKSAMIICEDADLDRAVGKAAMVALGAGQQCTLGSRLVVHEKIYEEFATRLDAALQSVVVGDPFAPETMMGPVVSADSLERTLDVVERARGYGNVRTGGTRLDGELADGYFMSPAVIDGIDNTSEVARSELFAPVLAMMTYGDDEQALAIANDSDYALAGYVFTRDLDRAYRLGHALDTDSVGYNGAFVPLGPSMPFGGRKVSGYGKQGGRAGVMEFTRTRTYSTQLA